MDEYDDLIRQLVPAYADMRPVQLDLLALALTDGRGRVLDLGGGTGALAGAIAERFPKAVGKHPFFLGCSIRIEVDNLLNDKPRVRDASGAVPLTYQADLLDPIGRTIGITFRKLFLPRRAARPQRR